MTTQEHKQGIQGYIDRQLKIAKAQAITEGYHALLAMSSLWLRQVCNLCGDSGKTPKTVEGVIIFEPCQCFRPGMIKDIYERMFEEKDLSGKHI